MSITLSKLVAKDFFIGSVPGPIKIETGRRQSTESPTNCEMATTAAEYHALVKEYYEEVCQEYIPRLVDVACEEAADLEANMNEVIENEQRRMKARVEAVRLAYYTAIQQRDSILLIAGVPPLQKVVVPEPEAVAEHIPEPEAAAPPAQAPEVQDAGSEGSADEKGRWIQKGTTYKISSFIATRIAEINAGTRTSPVASIVWKGGKFSPNNPHLHSVISFWQLQGPMNAAIARTRWASAGGAWERGGLRGAMRELIKQQILVPV
jgi:hypothetical protein